MSDGNRNVRPVDLIYIAVSIALSTSLALITTAANLRPKEFWTKPALIFVIFSNSNKQENLPALLIREPKISWKSCLRNNDWRFYIILFNFCYYRIPAYETVLQCQQ